MSHHHFRTKYAKETVECIKVTSENYV